MGEKQDGGSAFPSHGSMGEVEHRGMALRDWFAGSALCGLAGSVDMSKPMDVRPGESSDDALRRLWDGIAKSAFVAADTMMAEREPAKT